LGPGKAWNGRHLRLPLSLRPTTGHRSNDCHSASIQPRIACLPGSSNTLLPSGRQTDLLGAPSRAPWSRSCSAGLSFLSLPARLSVCIQPLPRPPPWFRQAKLGSMDWGCLSVLRCVPALHPGRCRASSRLRRCQTAQPCAPEAVPHWHPSVPSGFGPSEQCSELAVRRLQMGRTDECRDCGADGRTTAQTDEGPPCTGADVRQRREGKKNTKGEREMQRGK
jgi:hypothetical protein